MGVFRHYTHYLPVLTVIVLTQAQTMDDGTPRYKYYRNTGTMVLE